MYVANNTDKILFSVFHLTNRAIDIIIDLLLQFQIYVPRMMLG